MLVVYWAICHCAYTSLAYVDENENAKTRK